jgi:hypothetical protein
MKQFARKITRRTFLQIGTLSALSLAGCAAPESGEAAASGEAPGAASENAARRFPPADFSAMDGSGTLLARTAEDILPASPWQESWPLDSLPVYENALVSTDGSGIPAQVDETAMRNRILEKAGLWNLSEADVSLEADRNAGDDTLQRLYFTADAVAMEVDAQQNVAATLAQPMPFPQGMKGIRPDSSYDELLEAAQYLLDNRGSLLDLAEPQIAIRGGGYSTGGVPEYTVTFRRGGGQQTPAEQLLAAAYGTVTVTGDEEGAAARFTWTHEQTGAALGEYPIIPLETAQALLRAGKYLTLVSEDAEPELSECSRAELLYLDTPFADYTLPYYRFWIPLSSGTAESGSTLHSYGSFYVSALENSL